MRLDRLKMLHYGNFSLQNCSNLLSLFLKLPHLLFAYNFCGTWQICLQMYGKVDCAKTTRSQLLSKFVVIAELSIYRTVSSIYRLIFCRGWCLRLFLFYSGLKTWDLNFPLLLAHEHVCFQGLLIPFYLIWLACALQYNRGTGIYLTQLSLSHALKAFSFLKLATQSMTHMFCFYSISDF